MMKNEAKERSRGLTPKEKKRFSGCDGGKLISKGLSVTRKGGDIEERGEKIRLTF